MSDKVKIFPHTNEEVDFLGKFLAAQPVNNKYLQRKAHKACLRGDKFPSPEEISEKLRRIMNLLKLTGMSIEQVTAKIPVR